jgi:hypothetical protein
MKSFAVPLSFACLLGVAHASPADDVTRALHQYNTDEESMAASGKLEPAPRLLAHWKQLETIRRQLGHVHAHGLGEGERILLRHELSQALGQPNTVADIKGDYVSETVKSADDARRHVLVQIARWANAHLDFDVVEVLGTPVDGRVAAAAASSL